MLFAFFCTDKPDSTAIRAANRALHLDYVRAVADQVVVAGPTQTEDGQSMNGSLLVMEFADLAAAQAFAKNDPYNKAGLFESVVIRPWKLVFPES
jgi:hypothetical protein